MKTYAILDGGGSFGIHTAFYLLDHANPKKVIVLRASAWLQRKVRIFFPLPLAPSRGGEGESMRDFNTIALPLEGGGIGLG